jgi:hypothetical protein
VAESRDPWWSHIFMAAFIAGGFAAVPFWTRGLSLEIATVVALVIFPSVVVVYIFVAKSK